MDPELQAPRNREDTIDETAEMNNREVWAHEFLGDSERALEATNRVGSPRAHLDTTANSP